MSASILNARNTRRIARATGLDIIRAWSHGGYVLGFVTSDHRHGSYDKKTGLWNYKENPLHYTSCSELFPDWQPEKPEPKEPTITFEPPVSQVTIIVDPGVFGEGWIIPQEFVEDTPQIDMDIIRGIERVTGEKYEDGKWRKPSDS